MVLLVEPGGLLSVLAHRLGSLLGGLSAMLYVLLADLRARIQSLLVKRLAELRTSEYALVPSSESVSKASR